MIKMLRKLVARLMDVPFVRSIRRRRWERFFASSTSGNFFMGVYPDYATARMAVPANRPAGYDNPGPAAMYLDRIERIHATDYPVLYWLRPLVRPGLRIFDLGGHIGVSFYPYSRVLGLSSDIEWLVCDVPAVTRAGAELARERGRSEIRFTNDRADASGFDVFLASGSLQYLDEHLASILAKLPAKPPHLFVNMLPVHPEHEFVTLNSIGVAICPYTVYRRDRFLARVSELGYELIDEWDNPGKTCHIPFHESKSTDHYLGAYWKLRQKG